MNKLTFGTALAALAIAIPAAAPAQKIGPAVVAVVDTNRIFRECTACRAAQTQLQTQINALQQRAQTQGQALQAEAQPVQAAVNALAGKQPDAALTARIRAIQTKQDNLNAEISRGEQNIRSIQAHVAQQLNTRLGPIINQVMQTRAANIVIEKGATLGNAPALDVTADVLAGLNAALPSVSVTPLPQQAQTPQPTGR